jgi:predicted nucleic acid-binding protein
MHSTVAEPRAFVDSNVLVYAVAADAGEKQRRAAAIVERGFAERCYVISTQVLMEVFVTVTRKVKTPLLPEQALAYMTALAQWPVVSLSPGLALQAAELSVRAPISPWDAAIVCAAAAAGCEVLLTEDMAPGVCYLGVRVVNPFCS